MPLTVLVTGSNGFVGRAVCNALREQGYSVRAAVRSLGSAAVVPAGAVAVGAIDAETDWSSVLAGVDVIVHLAARVHVMRETESDSLEAFRKINVRATAALARAAVAHAVKRLVYVSSIKVNGEATDGKPFTAEDPALPRDAYATSKYEAERLLRTIAASTALEVTVVRPPLVYGPGVGGNFLRLLKLVHRGIPLPFGAIHNRRSMIYNGNLALALVACASHVNAGGKTYLVADPEDLSTPELVRRLGSALGRPARLWAVPPQVLRLGGALAGRSGEVERLIGSLAVDSSSIRRELAWSPPYAVSEALNDTAKWFAAAQL